MIINFIGYLYFKDLKKNFPILKYNNSYKNSCKEGILYWDPETTAPGNFGISKLMIIRNEQIINLPAGSEILLLKDDKKISYYLNDSKYRTRQITQSIIIENIFLENNIKEIQYFDF